MREEGVVLQAPGLGCGGPARLVVGGLVVEELAAQGAEAVVVAALPGLFGLLPQLLFVGGTGVEQPVLEGRTGVEEPVLEGRTGVEQPVLEGRTGVEQPVLEGGPAPPVGRTGVEQPVLEGAPVRQPSPQA